MSEVGKKNTKCIGKQLDKLFVRHRSAFSPTSGLFGLFIFLNNTRLIVEHVATGGSVALTFQVSFKQNLPALCSESTAHLGPQTDHVRFRQPQKQICSKERKKKKATFNFYRSTQKKKKD